MKCWLQWRRWQRWCEINVKSLVQLLMGNPSHSYGASLAVWDHSVTCYTPHKRTRPTITPASQAGTRFTYPGRMEGWIDLGNLIAARPGPTTAWSQHSQARRSITVTLPSILCHRKAWRCDLIVCKTLTYWVYQIRVLISDGHSFFIYNVNK